MSAISLEPAADVAQASPRTSPRFFRRLLTRPLAVICLAYLAVLVGVAIIAPLLLPQIGGQHAGDLLAVRQGPGAHHLLGTDSLGRDVLDRLLVGTRVTLLGVGYAIVVALALGVPLGITAGFFGGWTDRLVGALGDVAFSLPAIVLVIVVLSVFQQSMLAAMVTFGVLTAPGLMRLVRSAALPVREELYVAAARVSGLPRSRIIMRHVLPRITGPIVVYASLLAAAALLAQTGLAFLGLVVAPPQPSWGGMVADGVNVLSLDSWLIWPPGVAIALTVLALGLLGDVVREASNQSWSMTPRGSSRRRPRHPAVAGPAPDSPATLIAAEQLLSVRGLTVTLESREGPRRVVEDVNFDIAAGETVGVVGESGCGKTMTAMALLGLLPPASRLERGRIMLVGRDLTAMAEAELRRVRGREIAFVSQEPMVSLNPAFRVGWQLTEAIRKHHGVSRTVASRRAVDLLASVHLPEPEAVARRYPHQLSGGMAQRVAIARALAGSPKLLIADEPTTALDVTTQAGMLDLLRELQQRRGMALMVVTHDLGVVADICDRVIVMYAGQVVERGDVSALLGGPLHPYTKALLASNPHNANGSPRLATIPGSVPAPGAWPHGCHFAPRCPRAGEDCRAAPIPLLPVSRGHQVRCLHDESWQPGAGHRAGGADRA
jgi:peptide/nickel transport system permease protein